MEETYLNAFGGYFGIGPLKLLYDRSLKHKCHEMPCLVISIHRRNHILKACRPRSQQTYMKMSGVMSINGRGNDPERLLLLSLLHSNRMRDKKSW